jgi:dipeptidyl aminopeptidase/acylaminoacyl peptidase
MLLTKRHLLMILCLLVFGAALAAQGQETPPPQQATVDAAVQTLIAQTQGADTQMQMTGTIQAALESALTATAQAQTLALTATPPPAPVDWSNVSLASSTEIDLAAGPGRTAAYLAPDGEKFAYLDDSSLCVYEGETQGNCIELEDQIRRMDEESVRWSPDSRYLTFTENFLVMLVDADVWVWDTVENTLTDLTDDGLDEIGFTEDDWTGIDLAPDWMPDGRILFLRYSRIAGQFMPADIYAVSIDGQEEKLGTIQLSDPFNDPLSVYNLDVEGSQLVYLHAAPNELPDDGVWISDLDGGSARQLIHTERERMPFAVDLSPDGRYVLVITIPPYDLKYTPETSVAYVVDVESGEAQPIDPEAFVAGAGWTPEGSGLIYLTFQPLETESVGGVYVSATPGKAGTLLLDGRYSVPTSRWRQPLVWGANEVVLLSRSPEQKGILLAQLAR